MTGAGRADAGTHRNHDAGRRWAELQRTAGVVRAPHGGDATTAAAACVRPTRARSSAARCALVLTAVAGAVVTGTWRAAAPTVVSGDAGADSALFALTNQDRTANGVAALQWNTTLGSIGENHPYGGCGFTVDGRSYDMIVRGYFSHQILGCGQYVFSMMSAAGVPYRAAGENIGWDSQAGGASGAATYINQMFMASPEHRANILNPAYTGLGVGSWSAASWTYAGQAHPDTWMFSEEFAQLPGGAAPPPRGVPPQPTLPPRHQPAPTPQLPPARTQPPAPATAATPVVTPTAAPTATPAPATVAADLGAPLPLLWSSTGLLSDSVESVLEGFLLG